MNEQSRSYRQIRSAVLAEVAHLEWKQAVTVLASALNERAVEGGFQAKVEHQGAVLLHGQYLHPEEVGRYEIHRTRL